MMFAANHVKKAAIFALAALATGASGLALAAGDMPGGPAVNQLNLHEPVTKIAADIYWLHTFMLVVCTVIFIAVFGAMFYSVYAHRKSKDRKSVV